MATKNAIDRLTIKGFKSIRSLENLHLASLNVLIGANGAGKSSFVSYFRMLSEMVDLRLQKWTAVQGGADRVVSYGVKETQRVESFVRFGLNGYKFALEPTVDGGFVFADERLFFKGPYYGDKWISLGSGQTEAKLYERFQSAPKNDEADYCYSSIASWKVFHFHDTSDTAGVKRWGAVHDSEGLRPDASNLAAYLHRLAREHRDVYEQVRKTVKLAIPFFEDFALTLRELPSGEEQVALQWRQEGSDYTLWPSQLSDGSIRFICLVTALLQPDPPSTIIIDEPELGLHPYAIVLLGSLLRSASTRMQVIVSTQSVPLVNEFTIDELIDRINESLVKIDYSPNRYIALLAQPSPDAEIRDFLADLRACTEGAMTGSDDAQYSEAKFLQVKAIIDRFRGRDGQSEYDRRWTAKVTDVRYWFLFAASERWREDDSEHEHYSDSGGKSGGQKEKLAYTILAASLAYQFGLEGGDARSRSFRFVVIDEAFGRGSDDSAQYGLRLFGQLGLQLLIVTPLQKIHVIEPFVSSVGFVHNEGGRASRLRNLSIEEHLANKRPP